MSMKQKKREFPPDVMRKVTGRTGNRCERCGIDFDEAFQGEFHHIVPIVYGGDNGIDNCSLLCSDCHRAAPNVKTKRDILIYKYYFLRFASFKEAAQHYGVNNRFDLQIKIALDIAKISKK